MGDASIAPSPTLGGPRVIIIGSGCTGLAIANGLQKAGIRVTLFEKNAALFSPGDRDWNMGLHWGVPILKSLLPDESAANLQTVQVDPNTPTKPVDILQFLDGSDGTVLSAPEIPNFYRLRRSKVRPLMARGLDIRFGKKLVNIVYEHDGKHVTAEFDDGAKESGVLIIGTDGARSRVRSLLLGPEKAANERLTYSASFVQAKFTREQALFLRSFHPLYIAAPHPQGTFAFFGLQDAPEKDVPEGWTFFFYISWNSSLEQQDKERKEMGNKERLEQVRKLSENYCEPWKSAFAWVKDDQVVWNMDLSVWDPSLDEHKWDSKNGRVTLAGDAAHPMTYQRGQGLNHSIADAGNLVKELIKSILAPLSPSQSDVTSPHAQQDQLEALNNYEKEMKSRAGEEVRLSVLNTKMLHDWKLVMESPVMTKGLKKDK